jgi:heat shock protein HslJ
MNNRRFHVIPLALIFASALSTVACASAGETESAPVFDRKGLVETVWVLDRIAKADGAVPLERGSDTDVYTLVFDENGHLSGMAFPNRYRASYTIGDDSTGSVSLSISLIAGTQMASLILPPVGFEENVYYSLLQNARSCSLKDGTLAINTSDADGNNLSLVFIPRT